MLDIVFIGAKILLILLFTGYGLTSLLIPEKIKKDGLFIMPWIGLIFIVFITGASTLARIPVIQSKYIVYFASIILIIYAIFKKKLITNFSKETKWLVILSAICLLFNIYPLLFKIGYPTTISLGNLDPLSYTNVSEFLINNSFLDGKKPVSFEPHLWAVGDLLYYSYRWGSPLILAFFTSSLNLKSYQIYSILIIILFAISFPLVYLLARTIIKDKYKYLMIITFLIYGLNSIMIYMLNNVFFAQFIFNGLAILTCLLFYFYINDQNKDNKRINSYDLLIGLSLSTIISVYSEGVIFVLVPILIYYGVTFLIKRKIYILFPLFKILLITIIVNPLVFGLATKWIYGIFFLTTKTGFIGWEKIRYSTPFEMSGIYNLFYYQNLNNKLDLITSIPVILICLGGLYKIKNRLFILSYLLLFGFFYILYRFFIPNYYTHIKTVSFMLFIFVIVFSIGVSYALSFFKKRTVILIAIFLLAMSVLRSAYRTISQMYYHARVVDKSLISLNELNNNKKIKEPFFTSDLYLGEYDLWKRLWQEHFLDKKQIVTKTNYAYETNNISRIKYVLSDKSVLEFDNKKIKYKNIIWENEYYQLGEIEPMEIIK